MKKISAIIFMILSLNLFGISLNKYGHILNDEKKDKASYTIENNEFYITYKNNKMIGNAFFNLGNKYLTLTTIEGNLPTTLRIYDTEANLIHYKKYDSVINFTLSENYKFCAFTTDSNLLVINLSDYEERFYPKSIIFAVNDFGEVAYLQNHCVVVSNKRYNLDEIILKIITHNDDIFVASRKAIYQIKNSKLKKLYQTNKEIFEVKILNKALYFVEKSKNENITNFDLYKIHNGRINFLTNIKRVEKTTKTHDAIHSPLKYNETSYPSPIGNSYGEIQEYGIEAYCHPGVDFLGTPYENVYAVHSGYVKAVLTTGGDIYWRIAISNNDTDEESDGYLYAHLNQNTIPFVVGDYVEEGTVIGTLVDWPLQYFTHTHFARLHYWGETWDGNWWTADDPLMDVVNIQDTIPPTFENAKDNDLFAFRTASGLYLNPQNLSGSFDIIAKCYDRVNSDWKVDVKDIRYEIIKAENDSLIFSRFSYSFDMPLDTYGDGQTDSMILNTIYSRDNTCYSTGNYDEREYYHIITNSNGDSLITAEDAEENFNSEITVDGQYWIKVIISDAANNVVSDSMLVYFNNGIVENSDNYVSELPFNLLLYPNPFQASFNDRNSGVKIEFYLAVKANVDAEIYNIKGQKVRTIFSNKSFSKGKHLSLWNGRNSNNSVCRSGIYFCKINVDGRSFTKRITLLK